MDTLQLKNYRCFDDTGEIEFAPITVLVGANSSGKSSFLKFLPLLKQSMNRKLNGTFLWQSDEVDFKNFTNTVRSGAKEMEIIFKIKKFKPILRHTTSRNIGKTDVEVRLVLMETHTHFDYLKELNIRFADQLITINCTREGKVTVMINETSLNKVGENMILGFTNALFPRILFCGKDYFSYECPEWVRNQILGDMEIKKESDKKNNMFFRKNIYGDELELRNKKNTIEFLKPLFEGDDDAFIMLNDLFWSMQLNKIIDSLNIYLLKLSQNIFYIQPLRSSTSRYYPFNNIAVDEVHSSGDNLAVFLFNLSESEWNDFNKWTSTYFDFKLSVLPHDGNIEIQIEKSGKTSNIVDVGFGYSQISPIITVMWHVLHKMGEHQMSGNNDFFCVIEQPELHLHPRLQGMFARALVAMHHEAEKKFGRLRIVIETHSPVIVNVLGEEIGKTNISSKDINVLLFNAENEGMKKYVSSANYSEDGFLMNWPYGFFDSDVD